MSTLVPFVDQTGQNKITNILAKTTNIPFKESLKWFAEEQL